MAEPAWMPRLDPLPLHAHNVHVWRFSTDEAEDEAALLEVLSSAECARASRFRFSRDRRRFIVRRALLRRLLSLYVCQDPARLTFAANRHGKPSLSDTKDADIRFSLSHSNGLALVAVARGRELGVDVEWMRPTMDHLEVADRFFAQDEVSALRAAEPGALVRDFFTYWCCKEAWVKARGLGLSFPLDRCRIEARATEQPRLLPDHLDPAEHQRWVLQRLEPGEGYAGALIVEKATGDLTVSLLELRRRP